MKKLYIGNLPFSATEDSLQEWLSQAGVSPSGVNLIRDRFTGQSRGFAFVEDEEAVWCLFRWFASAGHRGELPRASAKPLIKTE